MDSQAVSVGLPTDRAPHFLTLPSELRLAIVLYLFADEQIHIDNYLQHDRPTDVRDSLDRRRQKSPPLLQVCRKLANEARPSYYSNLSVHFNLQKGRQPSRLLSWLDRAGEDSVQLLRRLEIRWDGYCDITIDLAGSTSTSTTTATGVTAATTTTPQTEDQLAVKPSTLDRARSCCPESAGGPDKPTTAETGWTSAYPPVPPCYANKRQRRDTTRDGDDDSAPRKYRCAHILTTSTTTAAKRSRPTRRRCLRAQVAPGAAVHAPQSPVESCELLLSAGAPPPAQSVPPPPPPTSIRSGAGFAVTVKGIADGRQPEHWERLGTAPFCDAMSAVLAQRLRALLEARPKPFLTTGEITRVVAEIDEHASSLQWLWYW